MEEFIAALKDKTHVSDVYLLHERWPIDDLRQAVEQAGYVLFHVDGHVVQKKYEFFDHVAAAMRFPDYFGRNWDALYDCMSDLSWWSPARDFVLLYDDFQQYARQDPDEFYTAYRCMEDATRFMEKYKFARLIVLLRGDADALPESIPDLTTFP